VDLDCGRHQAVKKALWVGSAAKVIELQTLRKHANKTCMLLTIVKRRVKRLTEYTNMSNWCKQARLVFVKTLLLELRQRLKPILLTKNFAGVYTL
jgi:hypothetical protein